MHLVPTQTNDSLTRAATVAANALAEAHTEEEPQAEGVRRAVLQLGFLEAEADQRGDLEAARIYRRAAAQTERVYG
ncbi:hypothetical protein [Rubrivirga sp.]|uniref:hypothetical protein n=1 Tax=Rubrivirga sp. TaxID=1885344 RepID=UPI003C784321